jgi:hypothetical protein
VSKDNMHPELGYQSELDGWSQNADVDPAAFAMWQQVKMVMTNDPQTRRAALNEVDRAIGRDDGTTLRSKSQLMDLRRKLSQTHEALLKAGR